MKWPCLLLLCKLLFVVAAGQCYATEVYVHQNPNGRTSYSDREQDASRTLSLDPGYSYYAVTKVYDGDTIKLSNGLVIRLSGINSPEVAGRYKNAEPGGEMARKWLNKFLTGKQVRLQMDVQRKDKYKRTLAYVFTRQGFNINELLLKQGLAFVSIFPPNLAYAQRFIDAQQDAQAARKGIWKLDYFQARAVNSINRENYKGWKRIKGQVSKVTHSRKYSYLQLSPLLAVRIHHDYLSLFPDLQDYVGKQIVVNAWPSRSKERFTLSIKHPAAIELLL